MPTAAEMVADAKSRVENLDVAETARQVDEEGALLVDLREPAERQEHGAIPGAIEAPRGMLEFWADPASGYHREEFRPDRRIILHCASGGRSALAAVTLQQLGFEDVAHLDGGFAAWKQAGMPVATS